MAEAVKPDVILALIGTEWQRAALLGVCVRQVRDAGGVLRIELCDLGGPWRPAVGEDVPFAPGDAAAAAIWCCTGSWCPSCR